ncbi:variably expressed lipoprotein and hemagglutinin (VlhA) family domain protein, partial [Mycoplasmoides gallisepticum]
MKTMKYIRIASLLGLGSIMSLGVTSCSLVVSKSIKAIKKPDDPSNKLPNKDDNNINIDTNQITDLQSNKLPNKDDNNINIDTNQITDLQSAKTILRNLITNQSATTESFDDYAKIKNSLSSAYTLANNVSNNSSASVDELKNAIRDLQAAINSAKNEKQDFDNKHPNLVQRYNAIKTSLSYQQDILDRLQDANYSLIKAHVTNLFSQAQVIINNTLVPVNDADAPILENLQSLNNKILSSARQELITTQINKVDNLVNRFEKFALNKQGLSGVDATRNNPQPWNYGFGGYSVDLGTGELTQPKSNTISTKSVLNYSYYRRMFWQDNTTLLSNQDGLTDVSW